VRGRLKKEKERPRGGPGHKQGEKKGTGPWGKKGKTTPKTERVQVNRKNRNIYSKKEKKKELQTGKRRREGEKNVRRGDNSFRTRFKDFTT